MASPLFRPTRAQILREWDQETERRKYRAQDRHWKRWSYPHLLAWNGTLFESQPIPQEPRRLRRWWRRQLNWYPRANEY